MPLLNDIRDHKALGREYKRGFEQGLRDAELKGQRRFALKILRLQIEKRFGPIPSWSEELLGARSAPELEDLSEPVLDAVSIEDLLK